MNSKQQEESPTENNIIEKIQKQPIKIYPEGHPMNELKKIQDDLFGGSKSDIMPITKRLKKLRHFERKKERIVAQQKQLMPPNINPCNDASSVNRPGSLWDMKELPKKQKPMKTKTTDQKRKSLFIREDNKIIQLEPSEEDVSQGCRADNAITPGNTAQELLEGTKMCVDDIKKIERFKDYVPGVPSKVLFLKNIAPAVTHDQLELLFIQFQLDNGGPIQVRVMPGVPQEQALVIFRNKEVAITALDEVNGTILCGQPIVVEFGRMEVISEHQR